MISWVQLWPITALPSLVLIPLSLIPDFMLRGHLLGGGPFREFLLNQVLLPVLPNTEGWMVVEFFSQTALVGEFLIALLIILNINAICLPLFWVGGEGYLKLQAFLARSDLNLKRRAIK